MKLIYNDTFRFKGKKKIWKILTSDKKLVYYGSMAYTCDKKKFEKGIEDGEIIMIKTYY